MKKRAAGAAATPSRATPGDSPALCDSPSYDRILDVALELTFPASDPIAVQDGCHAAERNGRSGEAAPRRKTRRG